MAKLFLEEYLSNIPENVRLRILIKRQLKRGIFEQIGKNPY